MGFSMLHVPKLNLSKLWDCVTTVLLAKMVFGFFNVVFQWNVVPASWKGPTGVLVLKRGDLTNLDDHRPIDLVSCAFKVFQLCMAGLLLHLRPPR